MVIAIIILNVALFGVTWVLQLFGFDLELYFNLIKPLAVTGDLWRLLTACFMHAGILHLLSNMFCLYVFGGITERTYGKVKFLIIYLFSGIVASVTSVLISEHTSLGASGAVFGVIGANLYLLTKIEGTTKRRFATDLLSFLAINFAFSGFRSGIDVAAHLGGLGAGAAMAFAIGHAREITFSKQRLVYQVGGAALLMLILVSTYLIRYNDAEYHINGIALRYQLYGYKNAYHCAERAHNKFPKNEEIAELYIWLRAQYNKNNLPIPK